MSLWNTTALSFSYNSTYTTAGLAKDDHRVISLPPLSLVFFVEMKFLSILMVGVALLAGGYGETKTVVLYHEDGSKRSETPYVNDKRHGTAIEYYEDGSKRSETPT